MEKNKYDLNQIKIHEIKYEKDKKSYGDLSQEILEVIKESDIDAYLCALKIKDYIKQQYKYDLNTEEIMYLAIHINKITSGERKNEVRSND